MRCGSIRYDCEYVCRVRIGYGYASREKGSKYMLSEIMKLADESMYRYKEEMHKQMKR